ncbi:Mu transposase C-terminal domain-containing protein [Nostoc sp. 'Peltigera membranacea cyanobiont' 232]|uniref:Mu transposase C-terminal domain-containing protein n=1 Tax=Nostoc sp. 'Peltigera membranacea cyanobiont' 232 TaxID=2014531 RepID=UPI000B9536B5|nr:Mu transposase C-terminal domain-containing protein [Nostoc sp. 'Peltigera membranacea cyanobiont' 232]OYE06416.1 transposase [Nostoc sp. 'Peltigera membranacea cyanobiont' 232]
MLDNHTNRDQEAEKDEIVTELSADDRHLLDMIQQLLEPCDRITYGEKQREVAAKLGKSVRTVRRLVKKWEQQGLAALQITTRADKGKHRIDSDWQDFIIKTYKDNNKDGKRMSPQQVAIRVEAKAEELGQKKYPSYRTVYRVLQPIIEEKERKASIRSRGWHGSRLSVKTRDGKDLSVEHSNHVWQCDHTLVDLLLVDQHGELLSRPWLTTVIDTYSRCIIGINLGYDAPSSQVVALALRHAILPKQYGSEYALHCDWGTYGKPEHFYTDGGKDFRSNHLQQIGVQLGFACHLRDRPSEGGIVERPFGTFNTDLFSTLPGYTGSNVQKRPEQAEKEASLTLRELERLLVRYIVDKYNPSIDARMGDQTRYQRWEAGLIAAPNLISEENLRICLMRQTRRSIYRGGYLQFENLTYRGENLAGYAGENVVLRFDPKDITTVFVYHQIGSKEDFLARAYAQDLETEQLSLDEAKAMSRRIRQAGKEISNRSILAEVRDRDTFVTQKKTKKERHKEEQSVMQKAKQPLPLEPEEEVEVAFTESEAEYQMPEVFDYEHLIKEKV